MKSSRAPATPKSTWTAACTKTRVPVIQLNRSGTRREELLLKPEILQKTRILRQFLYNMDEVEAMERFSSKCARPRPTVNSST